MKLNVVVGATLLNSSNVSDIEVDRELRAEGYVIPVMKRRIHEQDEGSICKAINSGTPVKHDGVNGAL